MNAKTMQTLANFARYEGKENSMEFMNSFLDEETTNMKKFLELVSGPAPEDWIHGLSSIGNDKGDLGRHMSNLHTILVENVSKVPQNDQHNYKLEMLRTILNDISNNLHRPPGEHRGANSFQDEEVFNGGEGGPRYQPEHR